MAIKTHRPPRGPAAAGLRDGTILAHAVCRDPRDIALSLVDAARKGLGWGGKGFVRPEDALGVIARNVERFEQVAAMPGVVPVHYEMLAFDTQAVARRLCDQLGIAADIARAVRIAKRQHNQFNIGRSQRWKTEMDPGLAQEIHDRFAPFIARWCSELPEPQQERGLLGRFRKR